MKILPKKSLGQNFLTDINIINKIIDIGDETKKRIENIAKNQKKFDVVVGMYHDQVLTPIKSTLFFS